MVLQMFRSTGQQHGKTVDAKHKWNQYRSGAVTLDGGIVLREIALNDTTRPRKLQCQPDAIYTDR